MSRLKTDGAIAFTDALADPAKPARSPMVRRRLIIPLLLWPLAVLPAAGAPPIANTEDFSGNLDTWWTEGGELIAIEDGRLRMSADNPKIPGGGVATAGGAQRGELRRNRTPFHPRARRLAAAGDIPG